MLGESGALSVLEDLQRQWVRIAFGLAILCFFAVHAAKWHQWPFINRLENIAYDARLLVTMPKTVDERIVIVDIDEKSLAAEGRWPWSRDKVAAMVDGLFERYKAGLVGFDVVFAEPEEATGLAVIEQLASTELAANPVFAGEVERLRPKLDHDRILAQSLSGRPIILGYFFTDADQTGHIPTVGKLPEPLFRSGSFAGRSIPFVSAPGYSANLAVLQDNATHAGHLISLPDGDGVVRRVPMLYEHAGQYYESLSLAVVRAALGIDAVQAGFPVDSRAGRGYSGMEWLQVGDRRVPVDSQIRSLVPFRGRQGGFPYVSATDVIRGTADPAMLDGRIVLVGTTAKGLLDLRATPVQADFPGVEVHANLVAGILDGVVKDNPGYTLGAEFVLVLATGLVMAVALPLLSPLWSAACTAVLLAGVIGVNLLIWQQGNWVFPLASGVLVILTLFLFNMSYGFFVESRGKRQLAGLFGEYVPPELVEEMSRHPDSISLESESRELTVLHAADPNHLQPPRHHRQVYGRRDHGFLGRAAGRRRARAARARGCDDDDRRDAPSAASVPGARLASLADRRRSEQWTDERRQHGLGVPARLHGARRCGQSGLAPRRAHQGVRGGCHRQRDHPGGRAGVRVSGTRPGTREGQGPAGDHLRAARAARAAGRGAPRRARSIPGGPQALSEPELGYGRDSVPEPAQGGPERGAVRDVRRAHRPLS
jgi:CHASE2 domain-containing sensor protein